MKIAPPPGAYSSRYMAETARALQQADAENHKRGRDIEVGRGRLILTSPGGKRFDVAVSDTGVITATEI